MTVKIDNRDKLANLVDAIVDDIVEMSIEDLRSEMNDENAGCEYNSKHFCSLYAENVKKLGQERIAEARRRIEDSKSKITRIRPRSSEEERRHFLNLINRNNAEKNMTLAARSASGGIDPDLDSAFDDWEELGDLEGGRSDER